MSPLQLQVIPDEWTGQPPFVPGDWPGYAVARGAVVRVPLRAGELVIPVTKARELADSFAELTRRAEDIAEMIRRLGTLDPAVPAALATGNSYQFASGGLIVQ